MSFTLTQLCKEVPNPDGLIQIDLVNRLHAFILGSWRKFTLPAPDAQSGLIPQFIVKNDLCGLVIGCMELAATYLKGMHFQDMNYAIIHWLGDLVKCYDKPVPGYPLHRPREEIENLRDSLTASFEENARMFNGTSR
jgi:hypothetical protein